MIQGSARLPEPLLADRAVYIVTSGSPCGIDLSAGLAELGAKVALIGAQSRSDTEAESIFESRAAVELAFSQAAESIGAPDLVVICIAPAKARRQQMLTQYTDEDWVAYCQSPLKSTLYSLQAAATNMSETGGAVVLLGPTLGYTGAANLVALSALVEGQRGLAKAAARQLGARGITVNWLALASTSLYPELSEIRLPHVPEMGPPPLPLGEAPGLTQILPVLAFMGSAGGRVLTGANLIADGGEWMLP